MRVRAITALAAAGIVVSTCAIAQMPQPPMPPDPMAGVGQPFDPFATSSNIPGMPRDPRPVVADPRPQVRDPHTGRMVPYDEFNSTGAMGRGRAPQIPGEEDFEVPGYNLHIPAKPPLPPGTSPLGNFPAETPAERMLEDLLQKPDAEINLGMAAYLVAADLPAFRNLPPEKFAAELDRMTERVQWVMTHGEFENARAEIREGPTWPVYTFASSVLGLGFDYPEKFKKFDLTPRETAEMFREERNVTLPGLLETHRGSCLTLPLIYVVIGQRLQLPLHLVTVGEHTFARWDDGSLRVNIEATITTQVTMAEDDSVYMKLEELTPEQIKGTDALRNLTNREVIGVLLHARSGTYYAHGSDYNRESLRDATRAAKLAPDSRFAKLHLEQVNRRIKKVNAPEVVIGPQLPPQPERKKP